MSEFFCAGAREVLEYAQAVVEVPGSCTVCLAILKPKSNMLEVRQHEYHYRVVILKHHHSVKRLKRDS